MKDEPGRYEEEERRAIQSDGAEPPHFPGTGRSGEMLIKRSVSPDGRIDSLSVEFSCPVEILSEELQRRARELIDIQSGIVRTFLFRANGERTQPDRPLRAQPEGSADGGVPAELLRIGGADGKWGRRLFITIQANGRALRLYGSAAKLAEHLETAGYPHHAGNIREGVRLDLACRVVTKESEDGFVSIEKVLPARTVR